MASLARSTYLTATLGLQTINLLLANRSFLQSDWLVRHTLKVTLPAGLRKQEPSYIFLLEEYFLLSGIHVCTCLDVHLQLHYLFPQCMKTKCSSSLLQTIIKKRKSRFSNVKSCERPYKALVQLPLKKVLDLLSPSIPIKGLQKISGECITHLIF